MINLKIDWVNDVQYFLELASTQDHAVGLARAGAEEGTLVIAEAQTRGRGRNRKAWHSPKGGLWFSFILRPPSALSDIPILNLGMGLSAVLGIRKVAGLDAFIKWPNDIYLNDNKMGGVLIDAETRSGRCEYLVVGMGLNTGVDPRDFPDGLKKSVTSIRDAKGQPVDNMRLLGAVLDEAGKIYGLFKAGKAQSILNEVRKHCPMIGKRVRVRGVGSEGGFTEGKAYDLGGKGGLLLRADSGEVMELFSGSVEVLS